MEKIPVFYSEEYLTDYPTVDCEDPARAYSIYIKIDSIAEFIEPKPCEASDLLLCHTEHLMKQVRNNDEIYNTAIKAAGGAIAAARMALTKPSFALIRPPGHHAGRNFNGGFCFFNNMAIAVLKLMALHLIRKALIIDIDLHYGNGTDDIVQDDPRIAFRNISAYSREEFFQQIDSALVDAHKYDIVGCSVGFDTFIRDWGALLFTDDYRKIGARIATANRRFFSVLEGGYYIPELGDNANAYLTGILEACS